MTNAVDVSLTVTDTMITMDAPANGATVTLPFMASGWALDHAATSGTGIDQVLIYATRSDNPAAQSFLVGTANYGQPRSDVGAIYGSQFTNSGYSVLIERVPAGSYHLTAMAHHAATNTMTAVVTHDITVRNTGIVWIDTPAVSQTVTSAFEIGGWALDPTAPSGTGVDGIQCWIFPNDGLAPPVFIGKGSYGWARSDVGAAFGSRFTNSGFHFTVTGMMPGQFMVAIFAHSTVTNSYSSIQMVHVTVSANVLMSIDIPSAEATISGASIGVSGWAIDRAGTSGTGVDMIHVYAVHNPGSGEPPIFMGIATLGFARSDVAGIYGARYTNSGYWLTVDGRSLGLVPGNYDIAVWAHSAATNTFNNIAVVRVIIQ
jgi:hypothetical protein